MSGREWKQGEAALIEVGCHVNRHVGIFDGGGWRYGDGKWTANDPAIVTAHPVVVLDLSATMSLPHDAGRTEAERLVSMLRETADEFFVPDAAELARRVADQIEAQTRPPKPEEPGKYGSIIAGDGREWIRYTTAERTGRDWVRPGTDGSTEYARWDDLDVIRVVSEGVTS